MHTSGRARLAPADGRGFPTRARVCCRAWHFGHPGGAPWRISPWRGWRGRLVGSGIAASIKGGCVAGTYGCAHHGMRAPAGRRVPRATRPLWPVSRQSERDGCGAAGRLGRTDRSCGGTPACSGDPGHQRGSFPHDRGAPARPGRDWPRQRPWLAGACAAGAGCGHRQLPGAGRRAGVDALRASDGDAQPASLGGQGVGTLDRHCPARQASAGRGDDGDGDRRSRERPLCRPSTSSGGRWCPRPTFIS
jgi:hypothetical protein